MMDAYVRSFESGGKTAEDQAKGRRALALLQLLGLFERPATDDCLKALWQAPAAARASGARCYVAALRPALLSGPNLQEVSD
jgi:hypothetical protein